MARPQPRRHQPRVPRARLVTRLLGTGVADTVRGPRRRLWARARARREGRHYDSRVDFLSVLSVIVGALGLAAGIIAYFRAQAAEEAARESSQLAIAQSAEALARATDAVARSSAASAAAAGVARQAGDLADVAQLADRKADRALQASDEALTRTGTAIQEITNVVKRVEESGQIRLEPAIVRWECEQVKKSVWVARNIGTLTARTALLSDATEPPKPIRPEEVIPRDVEPGDHLQFQVFPEKGVRSPRVRLTWKVDGDTATHSQELTLIIE